MMNNLILRMIILFLIPLISFAGNANSPPAMGLGQVALNMLEPVGLMADFVHTACFTIGGSFIFASVIKYVEHRRSPLMIPISTVIFLFIGGIVLILLPLLSVLTENGVHYSLMK
jgi:hypothetical protein